MSDYDHLIAHTDRDPHNHDVENLRLIPVADGMLTLNADNTADVRSITDPGETLRRAFTEGFADPECEDRSLILTPERRAFRLGQKVGWMMRGEIALDEDMAPLLDLFQEG